MLDEPSPRGTPAEAHAAPGRRAAALLKRWRWWLAVGAVAAGLAAWAGPEFLFGPEVPLLPVVRRDFVQSVVASGRVQAPHRVDIGAQITGTVTQVPVAEGQAVRAGQALIELDSTEARAAMQQADVAVAQAQARLRQLREVQVPVAEQSLRQARVNLDNARAQLKRHEDLFGKGFIGQAALDDTRKSVELAEAQWRSAQKQADATQPTGSDTAVAEGALAQARASADLARARLGYTRIVAPVDGTLISRDVERGDVVQAGKTLMVLSPEGETQLVLQIDEKNLNLLALGQRAQASADAYPRQRFAADLVFINPGVDAQRGSVEVKLRVAAPPPYLKQDMTVSVDIEVARRPQALLVPTDAVHDADAPSPWVLKFDGHRARRQDLKLGLRSGGLSEVLSGLQAGDRVVPVGATAIGDGSRLRDAASDRP